MPNNNIFKIELLLPLFLYTAYWDSFNPIHIVKTKLSLIILKYIVLFVVQYSSAWSSRDGWTRGGLVVVQCWNASRWYIYLLLWSYIYVVHSRLYNQRKKQCSAFVESSGAEAEVGLCSGRPPPPFVRSWLLIMVINTVRPQSYSSVVRSCGKVQLFYIVHKRNLYLHTSTYLVHVFICDLLKAPHSLLRPAAVYHHHSVAKAAAVDIIL